MIRWRFTPGSPDTIVRVRLGAHEGAARGGEHLLHAAQSAVPVDTSALQRSGQVDVDGTVAAVSFGRDDGAGRGGRSTSEYAAIVHERMDVNHPRGQAKFLEQPMHAETSAIAALAAAALRGAFG